MEELLVQAHNLEKLNIKDFNNCSVAQLCQSHKI